MESHETQGDYWGLMSLSETIGDSLDSGRLLVTHETQRDCWVIMRIKETSVDS